MKLCVANKVLMQDSRDRNKLWISSNASWLTDGLTATVMRTLRQRAKLSFLVDLRPYAHLWPRASNRDWKSEWQCLGSPLEGLVVEPLLVLLHIKRSQLKWFGHLKRLPLGLLQGEVFWAWGGGSPRVDSGQAGETTALGLTSGCIISHSAFKNCHNSSSV